MTRFAIIREFVGSSVHVSRPKSGAARFVNASKMCFPFSVFTTCSRASSSPSDRRWNSPMPETCACYGTRHTVSIIPKNRQELSLKILSRLAYCKTLRGKRTSPWGAETGIPGIPLANYDFGCQGLWFQSALGSGKTQFFKSIVRLLPHILQMPGIIGLSVKSLVKLEGARNKCL